MTSPSKGDAPSRVLTIALHSLNIHSPSLRPAVMAKRTQREEISLWKMAQRAQARSTSVEVGIADVSPDSVE